MQPVTLANKISLLFAGIIALAFSSTYFYVVPQLQQRLEDQSLVAIGAAGERTVGDLRQLIDGLERDLTDGVVLRNTIVDPVRRVADRSGATVTLYSVDRGVGGAPDLNVIADSLRPVLEVTVGGDTALRAATAEETVQGIGTNGGERVAQSAVSLLSRSKEVEWVVLYSRSLDEVAGAVAVVRGQILIAGVIAGVIALLGGYAVANALARRVRRLERAAHAVAAGEVIDSLPIDSADELGQLTRTFNDMKDQLERLDRARRDFIANASHELRTPIFSLAGFAELLESEDLDERTRAKFIRQMRDQTDRLRKLAVELLDLSSLDAGSIELHPESVDLSELARTIVSEFEPAADLHRSEVVKQLPVEGVAAWCDPVRVAQIMRILLDNALRHTPAGTPITIAASSSNGHVELSVTDTGSGLDPTNQTRVFDRFFTGDAASGSGLGLAIAKELAERMEASLALDSNPSGTSFRLTLPAA
ncbi:MAG: HAMP domain-containing histidine kinase [Thermoleophilaceae bacterium]|nr:HAMP domain-containing histidine kinase [Thermoleophilaceae bacterium]